MSEDTASAIPVPTAAGARGRVGGEPALVAGGVAVVVLLALPAVTGGFAITLLTSMLIMLIAAASLHLIVRTGHLSLGHAGFMGVGAYTAAILLERAHLPFLASLICGMAAAALLALVVGPLVLRLNGKYFVLVTFILGEILQLGMQDWRTLTGGADGIFNIPFPPGFASPARFYYLVLVLAAGTVAIVARILGCEIGRAMDQIRQSERLAQCSGVPVLRIKVAVFALACAIAGMAGVLQGCFVHFIDPNSFGMSQSLDLLVINVLGGLGSLAGVAIGTVFITILPELLRSYVQLQQVIFGVMLIVIMAVLPGGLAEGAAMLRARRRRDGEAPS